jgi:hypothetical protein
MNVRTNPSEVLY